MVALSAKNIVDSIYIIIEINIVILSLFLFVDKQIVELLLLASPIILGILFLAFCVLLASGE